MAVARIEWQCPGCERRFAIRADMETPELCPQCRAGTENQPTGSDPDTQSVRVAARNDFPEFAPEELPRAPITPPQIHRPSAAPLRKYPALKVLSITYKIFAALCALGGVVALVTAVVTAMTAEDTSQHVATIWIQLAGFVGSLFVAVTLYAFGELVQLLIDIESNTRQS